MKLFLAIALGKSIAFFSRLFKVGGGSAAPGLYALKIYPELVEELSGQIPKNVIITGTNGKTTTARILAHLAKEAGLKVIRNHTGSNLERGIASTLIKEISLGVNVFHTRGVQDRHLGIWELDEFAFNQVAPKIKPDIVVFLNVSRDQLDRYGEVDKVVNRWCNTLSKLDPQTTILINEDDENIAKLKNYFKGKAVQFGKKNIKNIKFKGLDGSSFQLTINHKLLTINLPIPGLYNIYNTVAAGLTARCLNLPIKKLTSFQPAFGRVEKLPFGYIFLIKNPAGATQVFETIAPLVKPADRLLLVLNDNLADGTDVSWIWDARFEELNIASRAQSRDHIIIASGTRAYDLAIRLKYAGFDPKNIQVEPNLEKALEQARMGLKGKLYILPTYTAMLELQKILAKQKIKQRYWEET